MNPPGEVVLLEVRTAWATSLSGSCVPTSLSSERVNLHAAVIEAVKLAPDGQQGEGAGGHADNKNT